MAKAKKVSGTSKESQSVEKQASTPAQPTITKTEAVKSYLDKHPGATPSIIAAALQEQGMVVTTNHISVIKAQLKKAAAPAAKTPKSPAAPAVAKRPVAPKAEVKEAKSEDQVALSSLLAAKKLATELGGIDKAKQALLNLAKLME